MLNGQLVEPLVTDAQDVGGFRAGHHIRVLRRGQLLVEHVLPLNTKVRYTGRIAEQHGIYVVMARENNGRYKITDPDSPTSRCDTSAGAACRGSSSDHRAHEAPGCCRGPVRARSLSSPARRMARSLEVP